MTPNNPPGTQQESTTSSRTYGEGVNPQPLCSQKKRKNTDTDTGPDPDTEPKPD